MLENYNFSKCCWDVSIDKISLEDRPQVIDYIEHITGLRTLCGRKANEHYRLLWVDYDIINGQSAEDRHGINNYFNKVLEPKGYKLTKLDFDIGGL